MANERSFQESGYQGRPHPKPAHKHAWTDWQETVPGVVQRTCECGTDETGHYTFIEVAETLAERNKVRRNSKYRRGYALTPGGQTANLHKQRRQNRQD